MFTKIRNFATAVRSTYKKLNASAIDNAETTDENREHWRKAKDEPANVELTPIRRKTLRERANYEKMNNSYCSGTVSTLATDLLGYTMPKLRIAMSDEILKAELEVAFDAWTKHVNVNLPSKLRVMDETKRVEGEAFPVLFSDDDLLDINGNPLPVSLNVNVIGPARITDPMNYYHGVSNDGKTYNDDGVIVDLKTGRPTGFKVVPPQFEMWGWTPTDEVKEISPRLMYQWFSPRKASQFRGYSELTPSLNLFGQLRRYDLATLTAAEVAAMLAGVMKTKDPVDPDRMGMVRPWDTAELERGTLLALPAGYDATQFKPEQPLTQYEMFINMILRQIGRSLDLPFGIIAGDSSRYNYSSARLDYQGYDARVGYDREQLQIRILNPLFREWLIEYTVNLTSKDKVRGKYLRNLIESNQVSWKWTFTKRPSMDTQKDAQTDSQRLQDNTTTLATVFAEQGLDWEEELEQRQKEFSKIRSLGLDKVPTNDTMNVDNGNPAQVPPADSTSVTVEGEPPTENPVVESNTEAATTGDIQAAALNGAQITSLLLITDHIVAKQYPADAAEGIITAAFPLMDKTLIKNFVSSLAKYELPIAEPIVETPVAPISAA